MLSRRLVFALLSKESTIAIISRQKVHFWVDFRYKTSALRQAIEVGLNTIAPRERASNCTSRKMCPGIENAWRHGFAAANVAKIGHFGELEPFWNAFCATENAITR